MTYDAFDIHQLDQAAPDAFLAVDALAADPETSRRLAERGEAVYGYELTRDLSHAVDGNPNSLAGWAALTTIRLVQANTRLDQALIEVSDERDEVERLRAQVADLTNRLHHADAENASHAKAVTAWANQVEELKAERDQARAEADHIRDRVAEDIERMPINLGDEGWKHLERKATAADYPADAVRRRRTRDDFTTATIETAYQYGYRQAARIARGGVSR